MKVVSWNVNSVRARQERLLAFLERHAPDVVCLQELKVETDAFPAEIVERAGSRCAAHGQRTCDGVALLARGDLDDVRRGLDDGGDDDQARLVAARVDGTRVLSVYVPNGSVLGSKKHRTSCGGRRGCARTSPRITSRRAGGRI